MRVLFCHDNVFVRGREGEVYSSGQFPYDLWRRYLSIFDEFVVAGRCRQLEAGEETSQLNLASGPQVSFVWLPNLSSVAGLTVRRRRAAAVLAAAIAAADGIIVRLPSEIGLLAARLADRLGKPLAVEAVACAWDALWNHGTWRGRLYAPVQTWLMRRAIERAPRTLYVSRFMQQRYPSPGRTAVIPDVDLPPPRVTVLHRRLERIRTHRGRLVLGLIGSIQHKYKGVHTALEALARVRDGLPDFELRVLGPGDPRPWQERAEGYGLDDQVRFCGVLPTGEPVLAWLDEIDLYLQPSFQESLGRALIEAMSRACPAIGSTTGGIPDLLAPGCLHQPGDATRLGELIMRAARDAAWQREQAQRNFELAQSYGNDVLDGRREAFWHDFLAEMKGQTTSRANVTLDRAWDATEPVPRRGRPGNLTGTS